MVTCLLLSSKVPEKRRAATRYGASMAQGPGGGRYQGGWWAFGGRSKEMQGRGRAWDPSAVLFSSFPSRAVLLQDKSLTLSQIGPAGNRRMRWANRRCFPSPSYSTPTPQHSKDSRLYTLTVMCSAVILPFGAAGVQASRGAAQLCSVMTGSSTEGPGFLQGD